MGSLDVFLSKGFFVLGPAGAQETRGVRFLV